MKRTKALDIERGYIFKCISIRQDDADRLQRLADGFRQATGKRLHESVIVRLALLRLERELQEAP